MKHLFSLLALFALLTLGSCDLGDDSQILGTYADSAAYLTIHEVDNIDNSDQKEYYFTTDNGVKIFLSDNAMESDFTFYDGNRIIGYFSLIESYSDEAGALLEGAQYGCEYGMRLFYVTDVYIAESVAWSSNGVQQPAYTNDEISYIYDSIGYYYDYININLGVSATSLTDIKFYVVGNASATTAEQESGYLNLTLYYESGIKEGSQTTTSEIYLSLDLSLFASQLEGMKGVILHTTTSNGSIDITIDNSTPDA